MVFEVNLQVFRPDCRSLLLQGVSWHIDHKSTIIGKVVSSVVVSWLVEPDRVVGVDGEVTGVDVVALENHLEYFRLVHSSLLHEVYHLVLLGNSLFHVVVKLHLHFILKLTCLRQEVLVLRWERKVFSILSQQVELADVRPRIESVAHWVHRPDSHILAASEQKHFVDFSIEVLPV